MAGDGISKDDLDGVFDKWSKLYDLQQKAGQGLKEYNQMLKDIKDVMRELSFVEQNRAKIHGEIKNFEKEQAKLLAKAKGLKDKNKIVQSKEYKLLQESVALRKEELGILDSKHKILKENADVLKEANNTSTLMAASFKSLKTGAVGLFQHLKNISKELLKEQKTVYQTEQSMGILSNQANSFRMNMYKAAGTTAKLGVNAGELAKMQGAYSEQVGRSVQLTEQGLVAMAEMAKGTMLGSEGAAEMAANMNAFGISVTGTRDIVEDMMNLSSKMGVNSIKVTQNLKKNMQLANRFHFKDGVKGMVRLAAAAAKMKLDMEGISGMADKVFRPEGAIEMAARLQTMGGEFAKLGDPFELMFKARNDFEGFAEEVGAATKEFAVFNSQTGEFEISGLALDRMREISDITGISVDKLSEMGRQAAMIEEIEMNVGGGITDDENVAFISSIAEFNKTTGQWEAMVDGQTTNIKNLKDADIAKMRQEKASLEERAKQAQTFDETWENIKNTFKSLMLPFLEGLGEGLKEPMQEFMEWIHDSGGFKKMFDAAKKIGKGIGDFIKVMADNPFTTLAVAIGGLAAGALFKAAQWVFNGRMLAMGFNASAMVGGGMMRGGGGGRRGGGGRVPGALNNPLMGRGGKAMKGKGGGKMGMMGKMGKGGMGMGARLGAGLGLGLGSMGMDYARENWLDDPDSFGGKMMGVGSSALEGAGYGAMLGLPGMLIGGLLGAGYGAFKEFSTEDKTGGISKFDDVIMRSGQAPIAISPDDDLMAAKSDGPLDKAIAKTSSVGGGSKITFGPLNITGKIELVGDGVEGSIDLDDPILMRELSKVIQEQVRMAIGGGKLNPNPA